jgi:hypothetical protein
MPAPPAPPALPALPPRPAARIARFLAAADARLPGAVEALWIEGSLALGDHHDGVSDIDLVAVTRAPLPADRRPPARGLQLAWTTWDALAASTSTAPALHPVTAAILHRHGLAARGPDPGAVVADVSHGTLVAYIRANLDAYWSPWLARARHRLRHPLFRLTCLHPLRIQWGVFGVPRQYVTVVDGDIVSKTTAARRYRERLAPDDHHLRRVLDEALHLRHRTGALGPRRYHSWFARRADMLDLLDDAIARTRDAIARHPARCR